MPKQIYVHLLKSITWISHSFQLGTLVVKMQNRDWRLTSDQEEEESILNKKIYNLKWAF
jgi:hypothetical protein